jgi:pimeloyl-ACP methyl ester carboxylesterase
MAGTPMTMQTRSELFDLRWQPFVKCEGQVEPGVRDAVWSSIMTQDPVGASWGTAGIMRVRSWFNSGWNQSYAVKITVPTFIIVGEDDANLVGGRQLYEDLPSEKKVLVTVPCASHFMLWEKQHNLLQWTSRRWVKWHSVEGISNGVFRATTEGTIEGMGGPANDCSEYTHDEDDHDD